MILRALKASGGDSLLLLGDGAKVLIDGGPAGVYNNVLRDELDSLDNEPDGSPTRFDLVMVSHIDADHIVGVLELAEEMIEADDEEADPIVRVAAAWHNTFSDMIAGEQGAPQTDSAALSAAGLFEQITGTSKPSDISKLVLSSVKQGRQLRLDLDRLNIPLNPGFDDDLVLLDNQRVPLEIGELTLTVVGPTKTELDDLKEKWKKELPDILAKERAASTEAVGCLDRSVSNLASIVVVAQVGDRKALLTGDARGDLMLPWLEASGHVAPGPDGTGEFHIVKLPHHGAAGNVSEEFFRRVRADHYVVSGNGAHGNPEPSVLEMLFETRPELDYLVHLTYGPDELKTKGAFEENIADLDKVLEDEARLKILRFPGPGETHIQIDF